MTFRQVPFWGAAFAVYVFLLAPFLVLAVASFEGSDATYYFNFPPTQFSLAWYAQIPPKYFEALGTSFAIAATASLVSTAIGTLAAFGIVRGGFRRKELLQAYFRLPLQIPFVVTGVVFLQFYYQMAGAIGINPVGTFWGFLAAHVFVCIPYSVGTVSSVLVNLSPSYEEAAQSCGASNWSTFWRVTFPLARAGIVAGLLYAFIISFGDVPIAVFLAGSGYLTLPVEIFHTMMFDFNHSLLPISVVVVALSLALIIGLQRIAGLDMAMPSAGRT